MPTRYRCAGLRDDGRRFTTAVGLRAVVGPSQVRQVVAVLQSEPAPAAGNWRTREKRYRQRHKHRDVLELAAVVRDLGRRAHERELASRERELYERTRRQLAGELGHALGLRAEQAASYIDSPTTGRQPGQAHTTTGLAG